MHESYDDIRGRIAEPPVWFDEHAIPRYCAFHPRHVASVYAAEVVLVEIACQGCDHQFLVAFSFERNQFGFNEDGKCWVKTTPPLTPDDVQRLHYGDPPNVGCCPAGPTMNSEPLRVLEAWHRPEFDWERRPELESKIQSDDERKEPRGLTTPDDATPAHTETTEETLTAPYVPQAANDGYDEIHLKDAVRAIWALRWWAVVVALCGGLVAIGAYRLTPAPGPSATVVLVPVAGADAEWLAKTREILVREFEARDAATKSSQSAAILVMTRDGLTAEDARTRLIAAIRETQVRLLNAKRQSLRGQPERVSQMVMTLRRHMPRYGTTAYWADASTIAQEIVTLAQWEADGDRVAVAGTSHTDGGWRFGLWWWIVIGVIIGAGLGVACGWLKHAIQEG